MTWVQNGQFRQVVVMSILQISLVQFPVCIRHDSDPTQKREKNVFKKATSLFPFYFEPPWAELMTWGWWWGVHNHNVLHNFGNDGHAHIKHFITGNDWLGLSVCASVCQLSKWESLQISIDFLRVQCFWSRSHNIIRFPFLCCCCC